MAYVGNSNNNTTEIRTTRFRFTATEGQVSFTGNDANGLGLSGLDSDSQVYLNGAKLSPDQDPHQKHKRVHWCQAPHCPALML